MLMLMLMLMLILMLMLMLIDILFHAIGIISFFGLTKSPVPY
jgi:hypothetical protein